MTVLYLLGAFVLGLVVYHFAHQHGLTGERLTKEEYSQCVQMVMGDDQLSRSGAAQIIAELQNYATDDEVPFEKLSTYAGQVIKKVKNDF